MPAVDSDRETLDVPAGDATIKASFDEKDFSVGQRLVYGAVLFRTTPEAEPRSR